MTGINCRLPDCWHTSNCFAEINHQTDYFIYDVLCSLSNIWNMWSRFSWLTFHANLSETNTIPLNSPWASNYGTNIMLICNAHLSRNELWKKSKHHQQRKVTPEIISIRYWGSSKSRKQSYSQVKTNHSLLTNICWYIPGRECWISNKKMVVTRLHTKLRIILNSQSTKYTYDMASIAWCMFDDDDAMMSAGWQEAV